MVKKKNGGQNRGGVDKHQQKSFRRRVYEVIRPAHKKKGLGKIFDGVMVFLILANIGLSVLVTFEGIAEFWWVAMEVIEWVAVVFFLVDYLLRIWTADFQYYWYKNKILARVKYVFSFWGIIDLLSFLPFLLPFLPNELMVLKVFRVLRVFRVFELGRNNDAISVIFRTLSAKKGQLLSSVLIIGTLMVAASLVMYDLEHEAQPEAFSNAFSGLWWATSAILTVGYGDVYPVTDLGRAMSILISILGVGLVAIPTGIISAGFVEQSERKKKAEK